MRIAFYAPIKPPDHPIPSGDRLIAGNLIAAMKLAGFGVHLASRYIAYSKRSDEEVMIKRKTGALEEAAALIAKYHSMPLDERPEIWVTYHPYCKAPDWVGPILANALAIPYVTVEAAKTGQGDEWLAWRKEAQAGIRLADRHLWFKPTDRDYLVKILGSNERLCHLSPFVDLDNIEETQPVQLPKHWDRDTPVLITVGMMRKGKKDRNFYLLAEILKDMQDIPWNLVVVGGGPEEHAVKDTFSTISQERIHWCGQVPSIEVAGWMKAADIFTWPGWREPIGMVYLEAAAQGLPTVAFDNMGVPLVVRHGETGLLAVFDDLPSYRSHLTKLLLDKKLASQMGVKAREFVVTSRSMNNTVAQLRNCLSGLD